MVGRDEEPLPDLDFALLDQQTFGDIALQHELLSLFLDQADRLLPTMSDLSSARQADVAHLLKGSCLGIGAARLAEQLQRYGDEDAGGRRRIQSRIEAAFATLRLAILSRLATG